MTNQDFVFELAERIAESLPEIDEVKELREELNLAQRQLDVLKWEDQGWRRITGQALTEEGPTLQQVKDMSKTLRDAVAESPLPKQANELRASYVFSERFIVPGLEEVEVPKTGAGRKTDAERSKDALKRFAQSRTGRKYVFGKEAQELISKACSTDGVYILLGDDVTKEVHPIPLSQIQDTMVNPDFPDEIWAYLRAWNPNPQDTNAQEVQRWYYTDAYTGTRAKSLPVSDEKRVPVDGGKTVLDLRVNTQTGWVYGLPDLWAGHVWARNYMASVKDGMEVTSLMAWLSAKVKSQSKAGSREVGVRVGNAGNGAGVQTYGEGNSIDTYATTGKAYDFNALRPIAALYALGAGVSVVDLLASPDAAGASYGSAQSLAPGVRRAISMRRDIIASWMERVLAWATGGYFSVVPASIEEVEPYRQAQILNLMWLSGLAHADEIRPRFAELAKVVMVHPEAPNGVLVPNNEKSLPRKDIDTDSAGSNGPTKTSPAPGQGKSDGTGGQGSTASNDLRTDKVTK